MRCWALKVSSIQVGTAALWVRPESYKIKVLQAWAAHAAGLPLAGQSFKASGF